MSTAAERLNNAIVALEFATPSEPAGRKRAVVQLADHWVQWWDGQRSAHAVMDAGKLARYAEWYARAWWMVGEKVREKAPDPRKLDASWSAVVGDELAQLTEGAAAAVAAGQDVSVFVKEAARDLSEQLEKARDEALWTVAVLGVVAVAVFLSFAKAKH